MPNLMHCIHRSANNTYLPYLTRLALVPSNQWCNFTRMPIYSNPPLQANHTNTEITTKRIFLSQVCWKAGRKQSTEVNIRK